MPASLLDSLAAAVSQLPGHQTTYTVQVLRSAPRRSHALFPHATNLATKIWQEEVLVVLSEAVPLHSSTASDKPVTRTLPVVALEANIYTIPSVSTSLVYISKVDTTGLGASKPSPTRALVAAFVTHQLQHPPHATRRVRLHVFARAQGQYLFPGSVENSTKHVLDDKALIRWWKATLSLAVKGLPPPRLFYIVPGMTFTESLPYVPSTSSPVWTYSHPYSTICSPLHLPSPSDPLPDFPLHDHIPNFPDDPKARFLTSLASSSIPPAGSPDDYDELCHALHARSFTSGSSAAFTTQLATFERDRALERTRLVEGVPGGVDEYWERLAFRQECCSGALVAFFAVVQDDEVGPKDVASKAPKPERLAVDHNVFTRLWSQFHNVDYALSGVEKLDVVARKWSEDVERVVRADGADEEGGGQADNEDEEAFKMRKRTLYELEVFKMITVDNPGFEVGRSEKRGLPEEKKVNVMVPRKKKKT